TGDPRRRVHRRTRPFLPSVWRGESMRERLAHEADRSREAQVRLDRVLALELLEELERRRPLAQHRKLPLDRREVARGEQLKAGQPAGDPVVERGGVAVERLGDEHPRALFGGERQEAQLEREAAQGGLVDAIEEVRRADEDAIEALHALEHLVDLAHLVVAYRAAPVLQ